MRRSIEEYIRKLEETITVVDANEVLVNRIMYYPLLNIYSSTRY